ncbi:MAG: YihY/virulence factor BrkB family protein, partial [Planctomycetota bacterium]
MTASPDVGSELTRLQRFIRKSLDLGRYGAQMLVRDRAPQMAAALAYRTLFSLIPVLVLTLVVLKAFLGADGIRSGMNDLMGWLGFDEIAVETRGSVEGDPEEMTAEERDAAEVSINEFLNEFIDNAVLRVEGINTGAITLVGIAIFIYAALSLLIQIEQSFNAVCRAPTGRNMIVRLTTYWTLLTLGSLAVFASFTVGEGYQQALQRLPTWLEWAGRPIQLATRVGITWLLLLFAYTRMPNTRVRIKPAAIGAFVAAAMWELAKSGLTLFIRNAIDGQVAVYGSIALLPIFLLWVYVTWLIVLFGLEVTHILQTAHRARERLPDGPILVDPNVAVLIMREIAAAFHRGDGLSFDEIVEGTGLREDVVERIIAQLIGERLLNRVDIDLVR